MAELAPDLCVTAAYGNILPQRFLDIPRFGTLNIHPSLLPGYRGAAPVQRALQVLLSSSDVWRPDIYICNGTSSLISQSTAQHVFQLLIRLMSCG